MGSQYTLDLEENNVMKASLGVTMLLLLTTTFAVAQHGSAPPGPLYPQGYAGDIFTGTLASADDLSDSITLESSRGKKEFFTGRFEKPCSVPTKDGKPMRASDIPYGSGLIVYYQRKKNYRNNEEENEIFAMTFTSYEGKPISDMKRRLYPCTNRAMRYSVRGSEAP